MSFGTFTSNQADLEAACAVMTASADPKLPLLRAAADGRIALAWVLRPDAVWPLKAAEAVPLPVVFLVGDDPWPQGEALGPEAWAIARKLKTWAEAVIVHGAGGEPQHYREAVVGAEYTGRCVMVETSSARARQWARFFACPSTLLILPRNGLPHPATDMEVRH